MREQDTELTDWDKSFLNAMDEEELLRLMHAANYLDVRSLFDASCQIIARRWEGKRVEDIRRMYGIANDFSPDQENQIIMENKKLGLHN